MAARKLLHLGEVSGVRGIGGVVFLVGHVLPLVRRRVVIHACGCSAEGLLRAHHDGDLQARVWVCGSYPSRFGQRGAFTTSEWDVIRWDGHNPPPGLWHAAKAD